MHDVSYEWVSCPSCGSADHAIYAKGTELDSYRYYSVFNGFDALNYVICDHCTLVFANPRLAYTDHTLEDLFPDHVARREGNRKEGNRCRKREVISNLVELVGDPRGAFLDVGCGFGEALDQAEEAGYDVIGTELYVDFVTKGRASGFDVRAGTVDSLAFDDHAFDVIHLDDVLEHLKNPFTYLDEVSRVLKVGGMAFIHTWAIGAPTTVVDGFGPDWRADLNLDLTAHATIFPRQLLRDAIEQRGLAIERSDLTKELKGSPAAGADHHIQFWDFYARKRSA